MEQMWLPPGTDPTKIEIETDPTQRRMVGTAFHGNTPFDVPYISHITGNLWQGGCSTGMILPENIMHVISLYPWEQYEVQHEIRSVLSVVMYDAEDQEFHQVNHIAKWVAACVRDAPTLVHCQAGLNRSSLIACRALQYLGHSAKSAISMLRESRSPACLCNKAFENFLLTNTNF